MQVVEFLKGISIRESTLNDAHEVAMIHVRSWQQSYKDIIDENYLKSISFQDKLELRNKILGNNNLYQIHLVAVYEGKIIGFCDAGSAFDTTLGCRGEIYAIYLLEEFKRLGIGKRFLKEVHHHLVQKKLLPYIAWVLKENKNACVFYQKNDGILAGEKTEEIGGKGYTEVAYFFGA